MINTRFELYKLHRELKRSGRTYHFIRYAKNEFGEPDPSVGGKTEFDLTCLYHETNSYIAATTNDNTVFRTVKKPMLLCDLSELRQYVPQLGDFTVLVNNADGGEKVYCFTGVTDICDFGLVGDISLEVFDDGKSS